MFLFFHSAPKRKIRSLCLNLDVFSLDNIAQTKIVQVINSKSKSNHKQYYHLLNSVLFVC